uniref:MRN complex-interacting protein N-terminal domain-containing protein n=1 Tax=Musa acuminata subsp. malaccensis TaxID=214687 RepID=A0A804ICQ9_MUSAM
MATLFIAVQCCRCSTMQVKQQKKSGNNWVCSVCNQRQSVRRIHARGHVASDLRSFVQAFNMARADIGSHGSDPVPPRSDGPRALSAAPDAREAVAHGSPFSTAKKRTDWSKYLDPTHEETDDDDAKGGGEQRVVPLESALATELPPEKSRRSSIPNCTRRAQLSAAGTDNCFGFKPSLAKRKRLQAALEDPTDAESTEMGGGKVAAALQGKKSGSSKSSEYLEEGDIQRLLAEEEVHPDFL